MPHPLLARLFGLDSHTPFGSVRKVEGAGRRTKTRLRVEQLETREVPAALVWTNATGDGFFTTGGNWVDLATGMTSWWAPVANDDVFFDGDVSNADCDWMPGAVGAVPFPPGEPAPPAEYHSVNLIDGYAGTVTTPGGFRTATLVIESGALSQPGGVADVLVSQLFTWTGGVLGGSHADTSHPEFFASDSALRLLAGSVAVVDPGIGNTLATGDTLSLETATGVGSTATIYSGVVNFVGGLGIVIDNLCTVHVQVKPATATFVDTPKPNAQAKRIWIISGGKMYVRSVVEADGGTFDSAIPVMNSGLFQVEKNALANIRGRIPFENNDTDPSFYQNNANAEIRIENGSKLAAEHGLSFLNGKLVTIAKANPQQGFTQSATVAGKVSLTAGHIYINAGEGDHVFGTLVFEDDVWLGGVTLHLVLDGRPPGTGDAGKCDLYDFHGNLLDGLLQPKLSVKTINIPQGGVNLGQTWEFLKCANEILAPKPTVISETEGVNYQVIDVNQNHGWWLKPIS